jgi:clan AA aspartic protease (TIGR02281 family)
MMVAQMCFAQKEQTSDYNLRKAYELLEQNDEKEALKYVSQHITDNPKQSNGYILRAGIYKRNKKYGQALIDINNAIKHWDKKEEIAKHAPYWWRASIYSNMEMYDKAIADYTTAYKMVAKSDDLETIHDLLYERAGIYYNMEDYANADADYRLMLKHNETDQVAMIGLVRNMIMREDHQGAIDLADKCEKYDEEYEEIYRFRMQAYDKLGKTDLAIDDAIRYFEKSDEPESSYIEDVLKKHLSYALAKVNSMYNNDSENIRWKMLKTSIYEWSYDYISAIYEYNKIEKEYGVAHNIYYFRSRCYHEIGDFEKAIEDITKCIEMGNGRDYYAIAERADFFRENGKYDEAIADFTKMIEILPTNAYAYYKRGWCYELKGDDKAAMENYNAGIDVDNDFAYIYLMRGELYRKQGQTDLANADFEEILKQDTVAETGSCRQYALHFLDRNNEAIEWMEKIVESDSNNHGPYYDKACLLSRMGKIDEAIAALRVALEKGYRSFAHIENDDDMDAIRNHPDFISLIKEYKGKPITVVNSGNSSNDEIATISEIQMKKMYSGVYEVACTINSLPLKFIFDTGASSVSISSVEASFMLKNGYLKEEDIKGKEYFSTATGEIHEGTIIRLKEIKIGDAVLRNVEASVAHNQQAPLLLGQSVLERFGTITIDNINSKLIIKQ